jgi:hypothetical protein
MASTCGNFAMAKRKVFDEFLSKDYNRNFA